MKSISMLCKERGAFDKPGAGALLTNVNKIAQATAWAILLLI